MPKKTYTVKEVASLLGFSTNTVYKYLDEGKIKSTRLGDDGRFRISGSEVSRLLQETGYQSSQEQSQPQTINPAAILRNLPVGHRPYGSPSLFDWFIGFLSVSLGFSQFIFPPYNLSLSASMYINYIRVFQAIIFVGGLLLISFDILGIKKVFWHNFTHIILGSSYLVLAFLFIASLVIPSAMGYLAAGLIILLTSVKKIPEYLRFLVYINLLYFLLGAGVFIWPKTFFVGLFSPTIVNLSIFFVVWVVAGIVLGSLSSLSVKRGGWYIKALSIIVTGSSFLYATLAFANGFWERAIYTVVLGSFVIIFPFSERFQSFTLKSKREVVGSFVWLMAIFIVGSVALYFVYHTFQSYILTELKNRVDTASNVVQTFMTGDIAKVSSFAESDDMISLMRNQDNINEEKIQEHIKQAYQISNGTIMKMVLVNKTGIIIDTYPFNLSSQGVDISNRDYFINAKNGQGTFVTGVIQPSSPGISPSILVASPIFDNGTFLGVLMGSVDITELTRRINQVKFGQNGKIYLADAAKHYIVDPDTGKTMTDVPKGSFMSMAVDGKSGTVREYNAKGVLSYIAYSKIDKFNWGIVADQPVSEVFRTYSITGFVIFLIFIMSGIGSLMFIVYFKK